MICVIPLRSGSKRLKDKNILPLGGFPVFFWPLMTAHTSGLFDKIILAVDSEYEEIAKNNLSLGTTLYIRDKENSKDESTIYDIIEEVVNAYDVKDEFGCVLYSTSALTTEQHLKDAFKILQKRKYNCVFPVVKQKAELFMSGDGIVLNDCTYCSIDDLYAHGDAWFMINIPIVLANGKESRQTIQEENGYIELKDYEAQDVHTAEDFEDLKKKYWLMKNYRACS